MDLTSFTFPLTLVLIGGFVGVVLALLLPLDILVQCVIGSCFGSSFGYLISIFPSRVRLNSPGKTLNAYPLEWTSMTILFGLHCLGLFSNSYIEAQRNTLHFLLASFTALTAINAVRRKKMTWRLSVKIFFILLSLRLSLQATGGIYETYGISHFIFFIETLLPLFLLPFFVTLFLRSGWRNFNSSVKFFMTTLVALFWFLQRTETYEMLPAWGKVFLPWVVYILCPIGIWRSISYSFDSTRFLGSTTNDHLVAVTLQITGILSIPLNLVLGLKAPFGLFLLFLQGFLFVDVYKTIYSSTTGKTSKDSSPFPLHVFPLWAFFAIQYFFATGHAYLVNTIHFAAGFVGFEETAMIGGGILVFMDTFASLILFTLSIPLVLGWLSSRSNLKFIQLRTFLKPMLFYSLVFTISTFLTMIFVFLQRRHLMVWRVFAWKYVFEGLFLLIADMLLIVTFVITVRISKI